MAKEVLTGPTLPQITTIQPGKDMKKKLLENTR